MAMRTLLAFLLLAVWGLDAKSPLIVFVCGDHEYSGESTLPLLAKTLETQYKFRTQVLKSTPDQNGETDIPGLEALANADLVVFYLRWRRLPPSQLAHIEAYLKSGKPVIGLRTTSHAFNFPKGDASEAWNRWGAEVFGTPPGWGAEGHTHFGHESTTTVSVDTSHATHPILTGVALPFTASSWLYRVLPKYPPADASILLRGEAIQPNKPAEINPVAWTWKNKYGATSFYTSLGHPGDFALEPFQRMLVNAIHWTLDLNPPKKWPGRLKIDVPYRGMVKSK
jgi:type 1 glutamine amidotransferase